MTDWHEFYDRLRDLGDGIGDMPGFETERRLDQLTKKTPRCPTPFPSGHTGPSQSAEAAISARDPL